MEKKVNLEGIFYNQDGKFIPLTGKDGNTEEYLANLRNTYMEAERNYFEHLLAEKEIREEFIKYLSYDNETLIKIATNIHNRLEFGRLETLEELEKMKTMTIAERENYHYKKTIKAEAMMCLLFAAIRDKAKMLELVKEYFEEIEEPDMKEAELDYNFGRSK